MQLFYTPEIDPKATEYQLSEEESKHAIRVLRLKHGDTVHLVDGRGGMYEAEITDAHPKRCILNLKSAEFEFQKSSYQLHIAIAPTKNIDRIEWFLEKATEIGIQEITPIITEHSERKELKLDRLNKVVVSAMKQSIKAYKPIVNEPVSFDNFIVSSKSDESTKTIAHCLDDKKRYLNDVFTVGGRYLILIGPEGDFSEKEIQQAIAAGFIPVSLGTARLRTETAALYSCLEVALLNR